MVGESHALPVGGIRHFAILCSGELGLMIYYVSLNAVSKPEFSEMALYVDSLSN